MLTADIFGKLRRAGTEGHVVLAVITLQIAVPTIALMGELPARFGFQMYSGLGRVNVDVIDGRGDEISVDLSREVAGLLRPDLNWLGVLPERLCVAVPSAVQVTVEQSGRQRSIKCG